MSNRLVVHGVQIPCRCPHRVHNVPWNGKWATQQFVCTDCMTRMDITVRLKDTTPQKTLWCTPEYDSETTQPVVEGEK